MRGFTLIVAILLFTAATFATVPGSNTKKGKSGAVEVKGKTFTGKVVFLDDVSNSVIVTDNVGKEMEFFLEKKAQILQGGKDAGLKQLSTKVNVVVTYKKKQARYYASKIEQELVKKQ